MLSCYVTNSIKYIRKEEVKEIKGNEKKEWGAKREIEDIEITIHGTRLN